MDLELLACVCIVVKLHTGVSLAAKERSRQAHRDNGPLIWFSWGHADDDDAEVL